jgi:hypothetical protein
MQSLVIAGVNLIENEPKTSKQHKKGTTHQQNNATEDELPIEDAELWKPTDVMNLLLDEREENNNNKSSKSTTSVVVSDGGDSNNATESIFNKISEENISRSSTYHRRRTTRPSAHTPVVLLTGMRSNIIPSNGENEKVLPTNQN